MKYYTPEEWNDNIFERIGKDWMLITAGSPDNCNTMTASFGGFGVLFFRKTAFIFVRPQRHTYGFLENSDRFSLSFFDGEKYRKELQYCGRVSGRDEDKIKACGFSVSELEGAPVIGEASVTVVCKKMYAVDIDKGEFYDKKAEAACYPDGDTHRMYVGEILKIARND